MGKKYLRGARNFGFHKVKTNTEEAYECEAERIKIPALASVSSSDSRSEFTIHADDEVYDSGSNWDYTDIDVAVRELDLAILSELTGAEMSEEDVMEEGVFDEAPEVAISFAGLRKDNSFRAFRYYSAKLIKYAVSHETKGENNNSQDYTLTFRCKNRSIDGKLKGTKDVAAVDGLTWLDTMPTLPAQAAEQTT